MGLEAILKTVLMKVSSFNSLSIGESIVCLSVVFFVEEVGEELERSLSTEFSIRISSHEVSLHMGKVESHRSLDRIPRSAVIFHTIR